MDCEESKKKRKRFKCEHCNQLLSRTTWYEHRFRQPGSLCSKPPQSTSHSVKFTARIDADIPPDDANDNNNVDNDITDSVEEDDDGSLQISDDGERLEDDADDGDYNGEEEDDNSTVEVWPDEELAELESTQFSMPAPPQQEANTDAGVRKASCHFLLRWQYLNKISDNAMAVLFVFIQKLLLILAAITRSIRLRQIAEIFPTTWYMVRKTLDINRDDFSKYVVCESCDAIYTYEEGTYIDNRGIRQSAQCTRVAFPRHPFKKYRKQCGRLLMKVIESSHGKTYLYPKKTYCYRSIQKYLQEMLKRPGFWSKCSSWNRVDDEDGLMVDVHDGKVWKEFVSATSGARAVGLMMNVDWFQPYKHTTYSLGAIYLVVQNLPREERFKEENVILVGLIPGPTEPSININSFRKPIVDDLEKLYRGHHFLDETQLGNIYITALLCASSDLPATRKLCGFLGHGANCGCSKCLHNFERTGIEDRGDYSKFDMRTDFPERSEVTHRQHALAAKNADTQSARNKIEKSSGARYTELHRLPYYNSIRYHVIDPMHNLLLGTGKHIVQHWKDIGLLTKDNMKLIQEEVNAISLPTSVGRCPNKFGDGFSSMTADEWKNWICIFSLPIMKKHIPKEHYDCWKLFAKACIVLCSRALRLSDVDTAHNYLNLFCKNAASLYGKMFCTINMHMHFHLKQCIIDYGPIHNFWCFGFERYNGILGDYSTNSHSIPLQLMRKFVQARLNANMSNDLELQDINYFHEIQMSSCAKYRGSLRQTVTMANVKQSVAAITCRNLADNDFTLDDCSKPLPPLKRFYFDWHDVAYISEIISLMYPSALDVQISPVAVRFSEIVVCDEVYSSNHRNETEISSCVEALWLEDADLDTPRVNSAVLDSRCGTVLYFTRVDAVIHYPIACEGRRISMDFARVSWFRRHPERLHFPAPVKVWCTDFEGESAASYIPVSRILTRCALMKDKVKFDNGLRETVYITVPLFQTIPLWN